VIVTILHQNNPVKDPKIIVELPDTFPATSAEVIVVPWPQTQSPPLSAYMADRDEQTAVIHQFLTRDTTQFTVEQKEIYQRICEMLQQKQLADTPRIAGLFAGFVLATDDFDDPLPDEELFWGHSTDEYGVTLTDESAA
jgi:hypothetical protein